MSLFSLMALSLGFPRLSNVKAASSPAPIQIDYPRPGSIFPPDISAPTFLWADADRTAKHWRIQISIQGVSHPLTFDVQGEPPQIGEIDPRCISSTNEPPTLSPEIAAAHTWTPGPGDWERIKRLSVEKTAIVTITGFEAKGANSPVSVGSTTFQTSIDPVGAPIFYRDVPLMPSATEKGVIKPLAQVAIPLIKWRLRSISETSSRTVLEGMHTCANCHSFSKDGKTLGIDMDGPQNNKGLYAVVSIKPQTVIQTKDMVNWNPTLDRQFGFNRVGFMSQVSPDGRFILTMLTGTDHPPENNYYVANFKDYRFLQVFFPTRGILYWYDRSSGKRHPLPGADDPNYVQTNGVWSPDGQFIVFARAKVTDPYPAGSTLATHANDPNEARIQYDLYRVPFNHGQGGKPEPIQGASNNGMSNSFPKVSPDGRWIVFVKAKNGEVMRPDSELYIVPLNGGAARRLNANMAPMNSWHSWSPNSRWLVFSSKSAGPYTKMYLTHIDKDGNDSPAILVANATAANRAVNLPEFVNISYNDLVKIETPAVDVYKRFDHATELSDAGKDAEALEEWQKLAASNPDDALILNNYGSTLARMGQPDQAIEQFRRALQINPQYHLVHTNLARTLAQAGRLAESLPEFQQALDAFPESADLHNSYGEALEQSHHLELAQREFERAIELNPKLAIPHNNLGLLLMSSQNQGNAHQTESEFRTAIDLDPANADAQNNLGTLLAMEGENATAERYFREALRIRPEFVKAHVNLAATLASESRFDDAQAELQSALKIDPTNDEAQRMLQMVKDSR